VIGLLLQSGSLALVGLLYQLGSLLCSGLLLAAGSLRVIGLLRGNGTLELSPFAPHHFPRSLAECTLLHYGEVLFPAKAGGIFAVLAANSP
jgi:hypothetical protein